MALESKYKDAFSKSQRDLGFKLFSQNAMQRIQGNDQGLTAEISDVENFYEVTLSCFQKELKIRCECSKMSRPFKNWRMWPV